MAVGVGECVFALANFLVRSHCSYSDEIEKSSFRRDAETSPRDACATLRDCGLGVGPITPVTGAAAAFAAAVKKDRDPALAPEAGCRLGSLSKELPTL